MSSAYRAHPQSHCWSLCSSKVMLRVVGALLVLLAVVYMRGSFVVNCRTAAMAHAYAASKTNWGNLAETGDFFFAACMFRLANHSFFEPAGGQIRYLGTIENGERRLALEMIEKKIWRNL